jgi:hypothetical protein
LWYKLNLLHAQFMDWDPKCCLFDHDTKSDINIMQKGVGGVDCDSSIVVCVV